MLISFSTAVAAVAGLMPADYAEARRAIEFVGGPDVGPNGEPLVFANIGRHVATSCPHVRQAAADLMRQPEHRWGDALREMRGGPISIAGLARS